jgi:hypothetical protein
MTSVDNDVAISQALIDKHRYCNTEFVDWWDYIQEGFEDDMSQHGIAVEKIAFSLSYCQSDYASFNGSVKNWRQLLESIGYNCEALVLLADIAWKYRWESSGTYGRRHYDTYLVAPESSEDLMFAYQYAPQEWVDKSQDLRIRSWLAVLNRYDFDKIEREIKEALEGHFKDLYRRLMDEYEYLTSDEVVIETIIANDWHLEGDES